MCERIKSDVPDIETSGENTGSGQDAGTASGEAEKEEGRATAFGQLQIAYAACKACEESYYYYTCMYVGLILLRNPTTAKPGNDSHQKLATLIGTMSSVPPPRRSSRRSLRLCVSWSLTHSKHTCMHDACISLSICVCACANMHTYVCVCVCE